MVPAAPLIAAAVSGGALSQLLQFGGAWLKSRHLNHKTSVDGTLRLAEHRDDLTLRLLDAAQSSVDHLQKQVSDLMPLMPTAAHLAEALDHLHALLHAYGAEETKAATRRAQAFLKRMRPTIGDVRQDVQIRESEKNVKTWAPGDQP